MEPQRLLAQQLFAKKFEQDAELNVYAPGRVNIIGEHTDYNDGFVMPCAINYGTAISGAPRSDHIFRVYAADLDEWDEFDLSQPITACPDKKWTGYVRGVVKFIQNAVPSFKQGANLIICGNVPHSAGLSSSASLEVAVAKFCQQLANLPLGNTDLALIGQQAENQFVGCQCGNMDQLISALGIKDHLLKIDCRSLETEFVPLPKKMAIVIINSKVKHDLVEGKYNQRRQQCEKAARFFGVKALRDVSLDEFLRLEQALSSIDPIVAKRAKHVISENQRVLDAVVALRVGDLTRLGDLMAESHQSMKEDFEITIPEIDYLVELAKNVIGSEGGARMTGGGFGGCIVVLTPKDKVEPLRNFIAEHYQKNTGLKEEFYVCDACDGVMRWEPKPDSHIKLRELKWQ